MNEPAIMNSQLAVAETVGEIAAVTREQTEIQSAIISAKKFPRNEKAAFAKAINSFMRPSMADAATYAFKRGRRQDENGNWVDNHISGPSVDCAREVARCWGNVRYGLRIISQAETTCHIKGYAIDLETNCYVEAEDEFSKLVQRKVDSPEGKVTKWVQPDERDLRELVNRRGAILVRNCILQILPSDLIDDVLSTAKSILVKAAKNELTTNRDDEIKRLVVLFDRIGVSVEMVEKYLNHPLDVVSEEEVVKLRQIAKSIKDGQAKREEFFTFAEVEKQPTSVTDKIKGRLKANNSTDVTA